MLVSTMIATLGLFTTTITANGLVVATIDGQTYSGNLPANWTLSIENGNETRVGGTGGASRKGNETGQNKIGSEGTFTLGYSVVDSRTINSGDKVILSYTKVQYAAGSLTSLFSYTEAAGTGGSGDAAECASQLGAGQQNREVTVPKNLAIVTTGSQWAVVSGGKKCDFQMTTYQYYSARAKNNVNNGTTATVAVGQGDTGLRIVPAGVKIMSNGYLTVNVPTFLKDITYKVYQGTDVLADSGQENLVSGEVTVPCDTFASGQYDIYFKATRALRKKMTVNYTAGTNPIFRPLTFYFGDINGDNTITQAEVDFVFAMIGKSSATPDWYEDFGNANGWVPAQADMNGDGQVTIADYNLVSGNVGRVGN